MIMGQDDRINHAETCCKVVQISFLPLVYIVEKNLKRIESCY